MTLRQKLDRLVWSDSLEQRFNLAGRVLAVVLRYSFAVLRDTFGGQLTMRSMSLVYTTLLSIVPLIAFSISVVKSFGYHEALRPLLANILEQPLGDQGIKVTEDVFNLVDNVKGGVLGGISLAFFIYTAVSMVQKVEESFNYVWYVARRRNFARRLLEYMVVLLIGPVAIVVALGMIATLRIDALVDYLRTIAWLGPIVELTSKLTPYLIVTAVFTFLYKTMPNTRVNLRSAFIGGLAGGSMWATISVIFASFVVYSTTRMAIYSGFAVAITTLLWLYLNWLILLIGAQLAFYHQNPAFLRLGRREPRLSNSMRERLALNIMLLVGRAFREGSLKNETVGSVARRLRIPSIALMPIVTALETQGLLSCTEEEELLPGREMSRIRLDAIVGAVREHGETGSYRAPKWDAAIRGMCDRIDGAVTGTLGETSLSELLDETENPA